MSTVIMKYILTGSTDGRPIKVVAVASPGTTIHTATANANEIDEIYLYACNTDSVSRNLTIQWGGTTDPDDDIWKTTPMDPNSDLILVAPGIPLRNGLVVKAFASAANVITIVGFVNRITQ